MDVLGYVRVSTDEQAAEGVSIEMQTTKLKLYCELHGLNLVDIIVDAGVSAKSLKRPGLKDALKRLTVKCSVNSRARVSPDRLVPSSRRLESH